MLEIFFFLILMNNMQSHVFLKKIPDISYARSLILVNKNVIICSFLRIRRMFRSGSCRPCLNHMISIYSYNVHDRASK